MNKLVLNVLSGVMAVGMMSSNDPAEIEKIYLSIAEDFNQMLINEPPGKKKDKKIENYREMLQLWGKERTCPPLVDEGDK